MLRRSLKSRVRSVDGGSPKAYAVIGWREWVSLPLLGIAKIKAKIDTGARTSCLHAYDVSTFRKHGRDFVKFKVHPLQKNTKRVVECEAQLLEWRHVTDSSGRRTWRPVIETALDLGGRAVTAEVTLIARDQMGFRMLVGRQALKKRWLVDPSRSFLGDKIIRVSRSQRRDSAVEEE
jgi:hypothetical protein